MFDLYQLARERCTSLFVPDLYVVALAILFSLACNMLHSFSSTKLRKKRRIKKLLEGLERDENAARSGSYECTTCPICMEPFDLEQVF